MKDNFIVSFEQIFERMMETFNISRRQWNRSLVDKKLSFQFFQKLFLSQRRESHQR